MFILCGWQYLMTGLPHAVQISSTYLLHCAYLLVGFLLPLVSSFGDILQTGRETEAGVLKKAHGSR